LGSKNFKIKKVISGGDSGIGQAVVVHFAREGAMLLFIKKVTRMRKKHKIVEKEGRKCILLKGDVSKKLSEQNV
jgi:NAD(P)-dependent dehydrogenase (short-subunit alcohol dehydrogenase family)